MYIPFDQLSDKARIWIYQANRPFEQQEAENVMKKAQVFLADWASHGNPLQSSATVLHNQFLVLAVEESFQGATGCAVDASIQFIRGLEQTFQVSMLDRTQIAFRQDGEVMIVPLAQLQEKIQQNFIKEDALIFDNTITGKADLEARWLVHAKSAWLSRYFNTTA